MMANFLQCGSPFVVKKAMSEYKKEKVHPPTYNSWHHMKYRCNNKKDVCYHLYGGRGISVCKRWENSYKNFITDMGQRPEGRTLDRINNDGNYEPSNCRWATPYEQARNSRVERFASINGVSLSLKELSIFFNINYSTLKDRIYKLNWDIEKALTTKTRAKKDSLVDKNVKAAKLKAVNQLTKNMNHFYSGKPNKKRRLKIVELRDKEGMTFTAIGKRFRPVITRQAAFQLYKKGKQELAATQL